MLGREPAVNRQAHAVDVSRPRAREISDEPSYLVGISDTLFRACVRYPRPMRFVPRSHVRDRKSTRLNSSHMSISYAVFCLKKKKISYIAGECYDKKAQVVMT